MIFSRFERRAPVYIDVNQMQTFATHNPQLFIKSNDLHTMLQSTVDNSQMVNQMVIVQSPSITNVVRLMPVREYVQCYHNTFSCLPTVQQQGCQTVCSSSGRWPEAHQMIKNYGNMFVSYNNRSSRKRGRSSGTRHRELPIFWSGNHRDYRSGDSSRHIHLHLNSSSRKSSGRNGFPSRRRPYREEWGSGGDRGADTRRRRHRSNRKPPSAY